MDNIIMMSLLFLSGATGACIGAVISFAFSRRQTA